MPRQEHWRRELEADPAEQQARIDLAQFVRDTFDGVIGDEPKEAFETQERARDAVVKGLVARAKRALTIGELANVTVAVGFEWSIRRTARQGGSVCGGCNEPMTDTREITTFRRASGPTIAAHRECASADL